MKFLKDRRDELSLKFAKGCLNIEKFNQYFPLNNKLHVMPTRYCEKYVLTKESSETYAKFALPSMIYFKEHSYIQINFDV